MSILTSTLDERDSLRCRTCGETKSLDMFRARKTRKGRLSGCFSSDCLACIEVSGPRRQLSVAGFANLKAEIAEKQGHRCAICGREGSMAGAKWALDHCHTTGKTRGILCASCNSGLGDFQDDITILEKAIAYLKEHQS